MSLRSACHQVDRLRDELRDAKSEVGRLQQEVAANDAVLAQAEAALEALMAEKQGFQQQLWEAREAERRATEAGVVWQQKVAELRAQLQAVRGRADAKAELITEASGSLVGAANDVSICEDVNAQVAQRMAPMPLKHEPIHAAM